MLCFCISRGLVGVVFLPFVFVLGLTSNNFFDFLKKRSSTKFSETVLPDSVHDNKISSCIRFNYCHCCNNLDNIIMSIIYNKSNNIFYIFDVVGSQKICDVKNIRYLLTTNKNHKERKCIFSCLIKFHMVTLAFCIVIPITPLLPLAVLLYDFSRA